MVLIKYSKPEKKTGIGLPKMGGPIFMSLETNLLTSILSTENDHLLGGEVDSDRGGRGHTLGVAVGGERAGVVDGVVGVEALELLARRTDEHVPHEEGVVGAGADDAHADPVLLIPAGVTVDDVDAVAGVEVVDSTLTVDLPYLEVG
jgi:hypothetical protein